MKPLTWWQRNVVQGRAEVVLAWVLFVLVAGTLLLWVTAGWAEENCWPGSTMTADVNPERDARIAVCEKRNFQQAVREAMGAPSAAIIVDKRALKELLNDAAKDGASLNVTVYEYDDTRGLWDRARPDGCLAKMEQAMRAIEKQFYYRHGGLTVFPFKPVDEPILGDVSPLIQQWEQVKQECWSKP